MTAEQTSEPTLQGRHLTRVFGQGEMKTTALNDVSITLERGHVALLMGPSGSGKSTLLAVLSGLLRPDEGQVTSLGNDIWKMSDSERERFRLKHCGFIFQGYNLFAALSAHQQLEMVLRWGQGASAKDARRRADEMLTLLGLGKKAHLRPSELSGGEKQRVGIGRALIKEPEFCFADEPTSALDWAHGEQVIELLRNAAHERGATVLIVAHDARIIPYVDRVYNLEDGCLHDTEDDDRREAHGHADGHNGELEPHYPAFTEEAPR
jgi:putative ABC transport system ATP-binding protein